MMSSRSRSTTRKTKRSRSDRSKSVARRKIQYPMRSVALANRNVGLGMSATTVLRTSFFYNATAVVGTGVFTGYLQPGSCFDPTGSLAAIQPQMFDQFAAQYNRYKVNHATVRMKITGASGAGSSYVWVAAGYPAVDSTALATYQAAASQQYAKTTSGGFQFVSPVGIGNDGKYLSFTKLKHDAVVGAKSDTWDIGAPVTSDPTAGQFMVLPFFIQGNAAGAHTWVLEIDIWQNVTFSQKKNTVDA